MSLAERVALIRADEQDEQMAEERCKAGGRDPWAIRPKKETGGAGASFPSATPGEAAGEAEPPGAR